MSFEKIRKIAQLNGYEFIHRKEAHSTMIDAKNFLINDNKTNNNCLVLADQQSKGRGRRGKHWISPEGNVYCSISFKNVLNVNEIFLYNILLVVTIKESLEKFGANNIKFKWPNDILHKNKKFSGVISESLKIDDLNDYVISGFGINIKSAPDIKNYQTTYVNSFCTINNISKFLLIFFEILFFNLKNFFLKENNDLIDNFKKNLLYIGDKINIKLNDNSLLEGKFIGINNDGSLILKNNNKITNLYNGSIIL